VKEREREREGSVPAKNKEDDIVSFAFVARTLSKFKCGCGGDKLEEEDYIPCE
jgi:hypothetical protein